MPKKLFETISVCLIYALFSMAFSFSAKFLFRFYAFKNTFMLLLYEAIGNILICSAIYIYKWQSEKLNTKGEFKNIMKNRFQQSIKTLPYSVTYGFGVVCGMTALSMVNIPMFLALRRTLIFFVFIFGLILGDSKQFSLSFGSSIVLITCGAIVAGYRHLNDDMYGYGLVILNNCLSSISLHLAKNLNTHQKFEPLELVFNNSLNLLPVFFLLAIVSGDMQSFLEFESLYTTEFLISITIVAIFGFCLNFCTNLCTMRNSPFAIALTHNIKDIFSTSLSLMLFQDIQLDLFLFGGILLSFMGSFVYSYTKLKEFKDHSPVLRYKQEEEDVEMVPSTQEQSDDIKL